MAIEPYKCHICGYTEEVACDIKINDGEKAALDENLCGSCAVNVIKLIKTIKFEISQRVATAPMKIFENIEVIKKGKK